jgi:hypothetical protein
LDLLRATTEPSNMFGVAFWYLNNLVLGRLSFRWSKKGNTFTEP